MKILSVGEILWDLFKDAERLGGAPFNFAVHARRLGHDVRFLSAVGDDDRGERALEAIEQYGLPAGLVARIPGMPTGTVRVALDPRGQPQFTIERPAAYDCAELGAAGAAAISTWSPDWVYFGTLHQSEPGGHALTSRVLRIAHGAQRFYDVNLRANAYTPQLVSDLLNEAGALKLNEHEVPQVAAIAGAPAAPLEAFCRFCSLKYGYTAVCVTLGELGSAVLVGEDFAEDRAFPVAVRDTVGAGDAFAAAFLHGLAARWTAAEIAGFANRVGALVASRDGAIPAWTEEEARALRR